MGGLYAGGTVENYLSGVRAWHILHGLQWKLERVKMNTLLQGIEKMAPNTSHRQKRQPYMVDVIAAIQEQLNLDLPFDATVFACLTTCFWSIARVGELTVQRIADFNPDEHVKQINVAKKKDRNNLEVTSITIPCTKMDRINGETIQWAWQEGPTDPEEALENHFRVNNPGEYDHLFSYTIKGKRRALSRKAFLDRLRTASTAAHVDSLNGHALRIGGTLEYLLRNISLETVKAIGRWKGEAFTLYLRKHAQILAPFLQATPALHHEFVHVTMPRVR